MTTDALIQAPAKLPQRLYLFKSCLAGTFYPGIERSFRFILNSFNIDYFDDPNQSSCTGFGVHCGMVPPELNLSINARNLALACDSGYTNVVCICPTSYGNLKECICELDDNTTRDGINKVLGAIGCAYTGGVKIYHAAEVLHALKPVLTERAKLSLSGVRVATHHGCHYSKMFYDEVVCGPWDYPRLLDEICEGFSCTIVDYSERSLCCGMGFSHLMSSSDYTKKTTFRKLDSVLAERPDVIVTMCAGCHVVLDYYQKRFAEEFSYHAPVLNVSQLVALLLGGDVKKDVCLQFGAIGAAHLVEKIKTD